MTGAMLIEAWSDTLLTTALLVVAVLLARKPFARHFGPRLTYGLWAIPALRLVLPPLPFADPVSASVDVSIAAVPAETGAMLALPADAATIVESSAPAWNFADVMPWLALLWAAGAVVVIGAAMLSHQRFRASVLTDAVELEPIGSIRLVMTDAVDGPVAFGMWRRVVAVPHDFFARYAAEERALAVDHELSHHRHGDLWANAAALVLLATQWFNPFAWRAIRAFRFDQEAACDARVLTMAGDAARGDRTASYATAIVKAAVGPRLSLAAPMAVHDNLQERLTMLTTRDISKRRGLAGRLLIGGAALAVLSVTATLVPSGIAAATQAADMPEPPAPPAAPDAPLPPEAPAAPDMVFFGEAAEDVTETVSVSEDGKTREVHRTVVRHGDDSDSKAAGAPGDREKRAHRVEFRVPGNLTRDDILATLEEQGITGARAEAIADRLEDRRKDRIRTAFAPMPPVPPIPPIPPMPYGVGTVNGKAMVVGKCGDGAKAAPIVSRETSADGKRSHVFMYCPDSAASKAARLSAMKKAREAFVEGERARHLSETTRAKIAADIDKAIAEIEKSGE
ncbi:M56 family metallopeptidase [Sphingopyxis kveilinensis]|uniref:M56 family metallopeptidase n=1 Tax=Sphingopyxis kveilinensis TaxID=3114367 RepID=UPI0030D5BEFF